MKNYLENLTTTQRERPVNRPDMIDNRGGGFSFEVSPWTRLMRFLILGSLDNTFYANAKDVTKESVKAIADCIALDPRRVVDTLVDVSVNGRAPKTTPQILALALVAKTALKPEDRNYAFSKVNDVCRIGTHLFEFVEALEAFGGWGRNTKRAVANWYTSKDIDSLAYQLVKYQQRNGWSHKDLLRLSHPKGYGPDTTHGALFQYVLREEGEFTCPDIVHAFEAMKRATTLTEVVYLINKYNLPRECVPTQWLNEVAVWEAMLPTMGATALIRNLGKMTSLGMLNFGSSNVQLVTDKLSSEPFLRKGRVHPISLYIARKVYSQGHGEKGSLSWSPNQQILGALEEGFYTAFSSVTPTKKNIIVAVDSSQSMLNHGVAGIPRSNPREAATAMAMAIVNTEPNTHCVAFSNHCDAINLGRRTSMVEAQRIVGAFPAAGTDPAVVINYARHNNMKVDSFVLLTDSVENGRSAHTYQAIKNYRQWSGLPTSMVCVAMVNNGVSLADPRDNRMLDAVGLDSATPQIISNFIAGYV